MPGQSEFYTDYESLNKSELSKTKLFQGLQVRKHTRFGYRPEVGIYEVLENIDVPYGSTNANPQYGEGGFGQYVINDFKIYLKLLKVITLEE